MTTSTLLPEQGLPVTRFNEELDEIYEKYGLRSVKGGVNLDDSKAAIRSLILEEIIGDYNGGDLVLRSFTAEQRLKLGGDTHGTK